MICRNAVALVLTLLVSQGAAAQVEPDLSATLEPAFLPIALTWSSRSGLDVHFLGPAIPTPLGKLTFGLSFQEMQSRYPRRHVLAIVAAGTTYLYDLGQRSFTLKLPNNLRGSVTLAYEGGDIYLRIPHPEALGPPRRIDGPGSAASLSLRRGTFTLELNEAFAFGERRVVGGQNGDLLYSPPSYLGPPPSLSAQGIMDLGPVRLKAVRTVPERQSPNTSLPSMLWDALTFKALREGDRPTYYSEATPVVGHTYALAIAPGGPYALLHVTGVDQDNPDALPNRVHCQYIFQSDGSRNF